MYPVSNDFLLATHAPVQTYSLTGTIGSTTFTQNNIITGTFHLSNQCTDTSDITLGSVFMGQLEATFTGINIDYTNWIGKDITPTLSLKVGENAWESVPLGVYRVMEAKHTAEGVAVTAYDNMRKFDRKINKAHFKNVVGSLYTFVATMCTDCHVTLGMSQSDFEDLPNATEEVTIFGYTNETKKYSNDIETYRDLLFYAAQTMGCFATIDRNGQLVFGQYKSNVAETISDRQRLSGAQFADYITNYTGIYVTNMKDNTEDYYGYDVDLIDAEIALVNQELQALDTAMDELEQAYQAHEITEEEYLRQKKIIQRSVKQCDKRLNWLYKAKAKAQAGEEGTFMDLGANPFLQSGNSTKRERMRRRVLKALDPISYTPFTCDSVMGAHYDLGDVIYFTGGHAGTDGVFCCVMAYDWTYNAEYQAQGFGVDPSISNVKSRTQKQAKSANTNALSDKTFINTSTPSAREMDGDIFVKQDEEAIYEKPSAEILYDERGMEMVSSGGDAENGYHANAKTVSDYWEGVAFRYSTLTVGATYTVSFSESITNDMTRVWANGQYAAVMILENQTGEAPIHTVSMQPLPYGTGEDYDCIRATSPYDIVGRGVSLINDNDQHTYQFTFTALDSTMILLFDIGKLMNNMGGNQRTIDISGVSVSRQTGTQITSTYIDKVNTGGQWQDLDFVRDVVTESEDLSDSGFQIDNRVLALKPSVMRAWFKADPPQVKRTFNQFCMRYTGKPDSAINISLHSNTGWLNKSIKKDSEGVFTVKSAGTVTSENIEYCVYALTGLTSGQRYYFNLKCNFKDGTTFGNNFNKGLGLVFNTTGIIDTDNWTGNPNTFDDEHLYYSMPRRTTAFFADFSFIATASTMYMCVVVADITSGQSSSLTLSRFVISKTERDYIRTFYAFDLESNDWLQYKPWGSGDEGGDGGASTLGDLDDVNLDNIQNGQTLYYNAETGEWVNDDPYELPIASENTLGGIKVGANLSIDANGVLSATASSDVELVELTQAQYNQLTPEEKADPNVIYFITDAGGGGGGGGGTTVIANPTGSATDTLNKLQVGSVIYGVSGGSSQESYSTTEQVVGTWIDGKPVYQTTYEVDLVQSGKSWVNTGIVISDIKSIISVAVNGIDRTSGMNNCPASTTALLNRYNNSNLQVYITEQWYLTIKNITVRYTKTTD